ncbi:GNAT family N-acetyltransferase [Streptomyces sp. NPDC004270]
MTSESKGKGATQMLLRDVEYGDVDAYVRMRCDPVMMAELGGPLPREGMEAKVRRDVQRVAADTDWTKMIVPDEAELDVVAGTVTLWFHDADGERISEIGWVVLPEYQGRGIGKQGVRTLLELARDAARPARTGRAGQGSGTTVTTGCRGAHGPRPAVEVVHGRARRLRSKRRASASRLRVSRLPGCPHVAQLRHPACPGRKEEAPAPWWPSRADNNWGRPPAPREPARAQCSVPACSRAHSMYSVRGMGS